MELEQSEEEAKIGRMRKEKRWKSTNSSTNRIVGQINLMEDTVRVNDPGIHGAILTRIPTQSQFSCGF